KLLFNMASDDSSRHEHASHDVELRPRSPHSRHRLGALTRRSGTVGSTASGEIMQWLQKLEATEEKLSQQIHQVQQQNETLRDEASRAKLCGAEATRFDRRLAELAGSYQGLSSEMELQMRRVEQMDDRLRTWKQELEEAMQKKFADLEQRCQQMESLARLSSSSSEDIISRLSRRLLRVESWIDERTAVAEDVNQSLVNLHARVSQMEDAEDLIAAPSPAISAQLATQESAMALLEMRMADVNLELQLWRGELQDQIRSLEQRQHLDLEICQQELASGLRKLAEVESHLQGSPPTVPAATPGPEESVTQKIAALLEQLREVAPKVIKHEALLQRLTENERHQSFDGALQPATEVAEVPHAIS
ncbi:Hypothetical protein (Fragment), partial [Durusdinium trenchii]